MSGSSPSDPGQAPGGPPQAGTPAQPPQAGSGQQQPSSSQFKSLDEAEAAYQRAIKDRQDANAEAANIRQRLKQLEDAAKTEEQKRAERLAELEAKSSTHEQSEQSWRHEKAILLAAPTSGISPALALKLIDYAAIKTDKNGEPTEESVKAALAQIFVAYPDLKPAGNQPAGQPTQQPGRPSIGASNPSRSVTGTEPISEAYLQKLATMGPEGQRIYQERRKEIQAFYNNPSNLTRY